MGRVIAITNQKGGVGKTPTCVNLAASMAATGRAVLLVDLDPQGNATMASGIDKNDVEKTTYDVLVDEVPIRDVMIESKTAGYAVVPSNSDVTAADVQLIQVFARGLRLRKALAAIRDSFDYVFIDCPPSLSLLTVNALCAADSVIVPMQCEYFALEGIASLTETIRELRSAVNPDLEIEGVLRTMCDNRSKLASLVSDELRKYFGEKVYSTIIPRNIKLAEDVDLRKVALATAGCVGADLANLANEAALRAVRKGRRFVTQEDMLAAFEFVIAGSEKKNSVLTEFEKKLVAYHEVGHAMVAYKQKNAEPVQKITIVPHTEGSLGYTLLMPEEDKTNLRTKDELMAKIAVSMGGRAAEEVVMNTMTNGASQDIQEATGIARNMVAMFGMSDAFGMMALGSVRNQYLDGGYGLDCAQDTAALMDKEVKTILDRCYQEAVRVIRENREDMDKVVAYLLEKETITGGEMVAILEGRDPATVEDAYASTRKTAQGEFRPSEPELIEAPARHISMTSEKIEMPPLAEEPPQDTPSEETPETEKADGEKEEPENQ